MIVWDMIKYDAIIKNPATGWLDAVAIVIAGAIAVNSTCFIKLEEEKDGKGVATGSATEGEFLVFARNLGIDYEELRGRTMYVNGFRWDFDSTPSATRGPAAPSFEFARPYRLYVKVNFWAVIITLISSALRDEPVFESTILLWVNLVMDSLGALALATDNPDENILQHPPHPRNASMISPQMYQYYRNSARNALHHLEVSVGTTKYVNSMISNTSVLMQVVNETLSRQLNHELNIFKALGTNQLFVIIELTIVAIQMLIICDWLVCIGLALIQAINVLVFMVFMKCVPDAYGGSSNRKPKPPLVKCHGKGVEGGKRKESIAVKAGGLEHDRNLSSQAKGGQMWGRMDCQAIVSWEQHGSQIEAKTSWRRVTT
ncbi:hypothetical protein BJ742DRAFT_867640 [Cladochytrium replicatum]|nr:hypothetical protein BJ742DRAFT_867640 [Cladochytrium replicatum]